MNHKHGGDVYSIERERGIRKSEILDFSVNLNPLKTPPEVLELISASLDEVTRYPDPDYIGCREQLAAYHNLPLSYITAGNGATELIFLYCRVTAPVRALVVAPTFSEYARALRSAGFEVSYFRLREEDGFRLDTASLIREITRGYGLVVLCNPNNPTGTLFKADDILELAGICKSSGSRLFVDESFMEFAFSGGSMNTVIDREIPPGIFVIRSLTKILSIPGLRLGYGVSSDEELNRKISEFQEPWSINNLAAKTPQFLLNGKKYMDETRQIVGEEAAFITEGLKHLKWLTAYSPTANFILLKLHSMKSSALREELLGNKILIRDASNFMFLDESFVRIAVKDRKSNARLLDALNKI